MAMWKWTWMKGLYASFRILYLSIANGNPNGTLNTDGENVSIMMKYWFRFQSALNIVRYSVFQFYFLLLRNEYPD